jgi:ADP-heptose:LPS heptosyltransferase
LASTCRELLELCLRGEPWSPELLDRAIAEDDGRALLSIVVERLGDLFEPRLCVVYERLFRQVIERVAPELVPRLQPVRSCEFPPSVERVYVLSRITLGADVAVTSVLLDAAKSRYPSAEIVFVGPRKNYELFEADPRIRHRDVAYARGGTLADRLQASARLWFDDGIVIDPDSRLTQLGLISVCDPERYFFFNSRTFGAEGDGRLPDLAAQWADDPKARPYIAPSKPAEAAADITVSLGVGENLAKRLTDDFERELLQMLAATGASVLIDKGGSPEERSRVERTMLPGMIAHDGAFAPFAAQIARSKLFVGYDSAAGHVASACGVPLISIAKGFVSERMAARWRPQGIVFNGDAPDVLDQVRKALTTYTFRR